MEKHITTEGWERVFESAWTQDWPKEQLKKFIRDVRDEALQAQQQKFRETLEKALHIYSWEINSHGHFNGEGDPNQDCSKPGCEAGKKHRAARDKAIQAALSQLDQSQ